MELDLLQKYLFIPLDIFKQSLQNKGIQNRLDAWLTFLSVDDIETITKLIEEYPEFRAMYKDVYEICQNVERVMEMFSKELQKLDRNTVQYMIDEMQDTIDAQKDKLDAQQETIYVQEAKIKHGIQNAVHIMYELKMPEAAILERLQSLYTLTEQQAKEYLE